MEVEIYCVNCGILWSSFITQNKNVSNSTATPFISFISNSTSGLRIHLVEKQTKWNKTSYKEAESKAVVYQINARSRYKHTTGLYKAFSLLSVPASGAKNTWGGEKTLGQQHDNTFTSSLIHHPNIMVWT